MKQDSSSDYQDYHPDYSSITVYFELYLCDTNFFLKTSWYGTQP